MLDLKLSTETRDEIAQQNQQARTGRLFAAMTSTTSNQSSMRDLSLRLSTGHLFGTSKELQQPERTKLLHEVIGYTLLGKDTEMRDALKTVTLDGKPVSWADLAADAFISLHFQGSASSRDKPFTKELVFPGKDSAGGSLFPSSPIIFRRQGSQSPVGHETMGQLSGAHHQKRAAASNPGPARAAQAAGDSDLALKTSPNTNSSSKRQKHEDQPQVLAGSNPGPAAAADGMALLMPTSTQPRLWPKLYKDSATAVLVRNPDGAQVAMLPATTLPGCTRVTVELTPLSLMSILYQGRQAGMSCLPAGLLECIEIPSRSALSKEQFDIDMVLCTLGIHRACFGLEKIRLIDIWLGRMPVAPALEDVTIAIPDGGFKQNKKAGQYDQANFQELISQLLSNRDQWPIQAWSMLGPGDFGPDAWVAVRTTSGKPLIILTESKLHLGCFNGSRRDQSHLESSTLKMILAEMRKDVGRCFKLPDCADSHLPGFASTPFPDGGTPADLEIAIEQDDVTTDQLWLIRMSLAQQRSKPLKDPDWIWIFMADKRMTDLEWLKLRILWLANHPLAIRMIAIPAEHHNRFYSRAKRLQRQYSALHQHLWYYGW
ncbi:hypothetical protein WJX74_002817 [Apatococcus lobatus]|uniref:NERD domain-containing protein n=1 Tax=Apatococcus lobatus TaxID=904363 RepID=A0AAW1RYL8_9CHLO